MTRGTLFIIQTYQGYITQTKSCEFNGDMYPGGHYENAVAKLQSVKNMADFYKAVISFDTEEEFNYQSEDNNFFRFTNATLLDDEALKKTPQPYAYLDEDILTIDMNIDYYDHFFSDYLFYKVIGNQTICFKDREGKRFIAEPGEVITFNFGRFVNKFQAEGVK